MTRPIRVEFPGALYHVSSRGNQRQTIFYDDEDRHRFLSLLAETVRRCQWLVTAYVLMSNHFHLVVQLTTESLSRGMQWLNSQYTQAFNRTHDRVGHVLQGRPHMPLVQKEAYFLELQRYVVLNPVRAHMVARPEDYKWSSYGAIIGDVDAPDWLRPADVLSFFGDDLHLARERYRRFVAEGIGSTRCPWDDLIASTYLGTEEWVEQTRERIEVKPRDSEHPLDQRVPLRPGIEEIIAAVADVTRIPGDQIRVRRAVFPRMLVAWLGCYEAMLPNTTIAASLRMRSASNVSYLVRKCERALAEDAMVRSCMDACLATLRRRICLSQI